MVQSPSDGLEDIALTNYDPKVLVVYSSSLQFNPLFKRSYFTNASRMHLDISVLPSESAIDRCLNFAAMRYLLQFSDLFVASVVAFAAGQTCYGDLSQ